MRFALVSLCALAAAPALAQQCSLTPLTPAQPDARIEEGERAVESGTFRTTAFALSRDNVPHVFDTASRIRRVEPDGRIRTVAGNGRSATTLEPGPALTTPLPSVSQILFSPGNIPHFVSVGRVFRVVNGSIEAVAGTGRPGFNGESGPALEVNLGSIVNAAFSYSGDLMILDGYNRVRILDRDGALRTIAGSTRATSSAGLVGDNGPATEAALSSARQIFPLKDGSFWIKDLSGRHLRLVTQDGIIRTINQNFEASINILALADGSPSAATANRVYPFRPDGRIETGGNPFPPFTGTPLGVGTDGALFFLGSQRLGQTNPLVRISSGVQTVLAAAPEVPIVDGQAPPYGVWTRGGALLYATTIEGKTGVIEARAGQAARFVAGGGTDIGDAEGKSATSLSIFGIAAFTVDGQGRIVVADVNHRRILVVESDGKVSVLKTQNGEQVVYTSMGSLSTLQRIAADNAGNIYWFSSGATPTGGVFTAEISVWVRSSASIRTFTVAGLAALVRIDDGSAAVLAGNGANFRTAYRVSPDGLGEPLLPMLPLASYTRLRGEPFFVAASRLFRGEPGRIARMEMPELPSGWTYAPSFVAATGEHLLVRLADGGFYRIENLEACQWIPQPVVESVVNAASFEFPDTMSPRQLLTVSGRGLGPAEGQGMVLDGALRATGQPAPYPALVLGNFSGANPNATLSGTTLPVIHSNHLQVTVQASTTIPASGQYRLYFSWEGLQLLYPAAIRAVTAAPGLFAAGGAGEGMAAAVNEDGSAHSAANPAAPGSVVQLFGTGLGAITSNVALGDFYSPASQIRTTNEVSAAIGGEAAEVLFAGAAPGMAGGVYRIDVRVPENLEPGRHRVEVLVDGQAEPSAQKVFLQVGGN